MASVKLNLLRNYDPANCLIQNPSKIVSGEVPLQNSQADRENMASV